MQRNERKILLGSACSLAVLTALVFSQSASAHGYLSSPPSRAALCQQGENTGCGGAQYEPQSVGEVRTGFPLTGPVDGQIASGGNGRFAQLDAQTPTRWAKTDIKDRTVDFEWMYHAAHVTSGWEYYITKTGWDQTQPLSRAAFELTPFCSVAGNGAVPIDGPAGGHGLGKNKHTCTIPDDRDGHHVILANWSVADTNMTFHSVTDVNIEADGTPVDGFKALGSLTPRGELQPGDKVTLRAFAGSTPSESFNVDLNVTVPTSATQWVFDMATKMNAEQTLVRAGERNAEGEIVPVMGINKLFAQAQSGITSYQLQFDLVPDQDAMLEVQAAEAEYTLDKGNANVDLTLLTNRDLTIEASVFDADYRRVGSVTQRVNTSAASVSIPVRSIPGAHQITLVGSSDDNRISLQAVRPIELTGEAGGADYDHVYGEVSPALFKAGVKVLNQGEVYECKPFPAEGWCAQAPAAYEPGVGFAWQDAWNKL
jgi:predicted carbohydrate-binding protein with CBM5 and CBM33 domain